MTDEPAYRRIFRLGFGVHRAEQETDEEIESHIALAADAGTRSRSRGGGRDAQVVPALRASRSNPLQALQQE